MARKRGVKCKDRQVGHSPFRSRQGNQSTNDPRNNLSIPNLSISLSVSKVTYCSEYCHIENTEETTGNTRSKKDLFRLEVGAGTFGFGSLKLGLPFGSGRVSLGNDALIGKKEGGGGRSRGKGFWVSTASETITKTSVCLKKGPTPELTLRQRTNREHQRRHHQRNFCSKPGLDECRPSSRVSRGVRR